MSEESGERVEQKEWRKEKRGGKEKDLAGWILIIFAFVNLGLFSAGAITTRAGWFGD